MAWIAFDDQTRNALNAISDLPVKLEMRQDDPMQCALHTNGNSLVLFPGATPGEILLLTVRKKTAVEPAAPPPRQTTTPSIQYVSGGFLGLSDEIALEDEPEKPKSWWKRLFD